LRSTPQPRGILKTTRKEQNHMSKRSRRSSQQQQALKQVDRLAWLLDNSINVPLINYRIGLDALIGLIPGLGDVAGMVLSSFIVLQAVRLGAPRAVLTRMVVNIGIEAVLGLIPVLGDLFDATFKANVRNVQLLTAVLEGVPANRAAPPLVSRWVVIGVVLALLAILVLVGWAGVALLAWLIGLLNN
jgi:hypothetical protein